MYSVSIKTQFNAAHRLRDYKGKCENLHGHNWNVEVTLISASLNKLGMVKDFTDIKEPVNNFLNSLDHSYLNELSEFKEINPTSENLAFLIFKKMSLLLNDEQIKVHNVTVWETEQNKASYEE